jgi:transcriptional regulator with XRE-family HTH domain
MGAVLAGETVTHFREEVISSLFVMDEQLKDFARNVIAQMTHQKLSTAQLAKKAVIATKTLNNLLKGRHAPQADVLAKIADALNVALWQLWLPEFPADMAHDATFPHLIRTASKLTPAALKNVSHVADLELQAGRRS